MTYWYVDTSGKEHRTRGVFVGWQLATGDLAPPVAVFQRRVTKLWIPLPCLRHDTRAALPSPFTSR